jgi:vacuole morphology and inheritance protein 14
LILHLVLAHPFVSAPITADWSVSEEEIRLTALRWIDSFFDICPEDILPFVPRLLSQVLPAMASDVEQVRQAAHRVNTSLMEYIVSLSEESVTSDVPPTGQSRSMTPRDTVTADRRDSTSNTRSVLLSGDIQTPPTASVSSNTNQSTMDLDYAAAVNALTLQFLNEHEATRVAALTWLIMLHRKAPRKVCTSPPKGDVRINTGN